MSQTTILELIADTIESRPVLGHWPHMRAQADAEYLREISKQWTGLSDEVSALRAEKACRDSERAEDVPTEIRRLRLEPGDILVFKVNPRPTMAMMEPGRADHWRYRAAYAGVLRPLDVSSWQGVREALRHSTRVIGAH
jgi:hypothetical protein